MLTAMMSEDTSDKWGWFKEYTRQLDKLRNQKFTETFPELFSQIKHIWNNVSGKL